MTFKILLIVYRKPGLTPDEFKQKYENHVQLVKRLAGDDFPLSHTRRYIARTVVDEADGDGVNAKTPATVIIGSQDAFPYDAVAELTFTDQAAFQAFGAKMMSPPASEELAVDEEGFLDRPKLQIVVLGDVVETTK